MKKNEYLAGVHKAWTQGLISDEAYDAAIMNAEVFCDEDDDDELLHERRTS